jgi:hypothetical protein
MDKTWRIDRLSMFDRAQFLGQFLGAQYIIGYGYNLSVTCVNKEIQSED